MKKFRYWYLAVLLASFCACSTPDKPGSGLYFFKNISIENGGPDSLLTPSSFLELRPDGSYTQDFGHFDYGTWMLQDKRLYLTNQHHRTYIYLLQLKTKRGLQ